MNPALKKKLGGFIDRVSKLMEQQKETAGEIAELTREANEATGVFVKNIKRLAKDKLLDKDQIEELKAGEEQLDECRVALGILKDFPLGQAAVEASDKKKDDKKKPDKKPAPTKKKAAGKPKPEAEEDDDDEFNKGVTQFHEDTVAH